MLLASEYSRLILAEREACGRIETLLRLQGEAEAAGEHRWSAVDDELRRARAHLERVSRLLDYNAGATTKDVEEVLTA